MKPKLFIVTGNAMKFEQLALGLKDFFDCEQKVFDEPEIQGSAEEILVYKLKKAFEKFKNPVLVDDVSLHFEKLHDLPGPYIKDFLTILPSYEMGNKLVGSRVKLACFLGLYDGIKEPIIAKGLVTGVVVKPKEIKDKPFNFDIFVQLDGTDKPMIEFSPEEKNKISHRGLAMKNLLMILEKENK
ncbi:MAG TPA: non-canonical purine NTP pyrophosphatase [Candidatus Paceibacterota bacterium]|jgi:non-canonical purine NTP pyrophosphatase (RdgB/HAM1 family)|nr:non-canonical purine NTP pyrophosphatase [Candidatus Paceibacterota bacterium]